MQRSCTFCSDALDGATCCSVCWFHTMHTGVGCLRSCDVRSNIWGQPYTLTWLSACHSFHIWPQPSELRMIAQTCAWAVVSSWASVW